MKRGKELKMTNEIITKFDETTISNRKLQNYTKQIFNQGLSIKKSFAKIAVILVKIDESKCYEQDGFESVQDYANKVLGWKQANTYAMLKVGREYLDSKTYESVLPHGETDYSTSQLQALLPLKSVDKAKELAEHKEISPDMTVKAIKDVVKQYTGKSSNVESESEDTQESENEASEIVDVDFYKVDHEVKLATDKDGNKVVLFDDVVCTLESVIEAITNWR